MRPAPPEQSLSSLDVSERTTAFLSRHALKAALALAAIVSDINRANSRAGGSTHSAPLT